MAEIGLTLFSLLFWNFTILDVLTVFSAGQTVRAIEPTVFLPLSDMKIGHKPSTVTCLMTSDAYPL